MSIHSILEEIKNTSSRKDKEAILTQHLDNALLKHVINITYNPHIDFYIKEFSKIDKVNSFDFTLEQAIDLLLTEVSTRNITGNEAKELIESIWTRLNDDDRYVFESIIKRDLRCGCSIKTFNKVWPGIIYDPAYMRCSSFSIKNLKNIEYPCYSQLKADGQYCNIIIKDGKVLYESRNGIPAKYKLPDAVESKMVQLLEGHVLHGEAVTYDDESGFVIDRQVSNGYLNSDEVDPDRVVLEVWDIITYEEFMNSISKVQYSKRLSTLKKATEELNTKHIQLIPTVECQDMDEVIKHFREMSEFGYEGTVVKNKHGLWKYNTSKDQIKMKCMFDCDLKVIDVKEGTGKNKGLLGAVLCQSSDGKILNWVGTGFKDSDRKKYKYDNIVGKIVTIKANDVITSNQKETESLFLPVFVEVRNDKTEADSSEQVKHQMKSFFDTLKFV